MSKVKTWTDFNKFSFSTIAINESNPAQVLSDEDAKATEQARKYLEEKGIKVGSISVSFSSDGVEAAPKEDPNKTVSYSTGGITGGDRIGHTGAHTSDSGGKIGNLGDIVANAAQYAANMVMENTYAAVA